MKAYILVHTEVGREKSAAAAMLRLPRVRTVDVVHGPYDVIAEAEADHHRDLAREVLDPIRSTPGVIRVVMCPGASHIPIWDAEPEALASNG